MQDYALCPKCILLLGEQEAGKEDGLAGDVEEGFPEG